MNIFADIEKEGTPRSEPVSLNTSHLDQLMAQIEAMKVQMSSFVSANSANTSLNSHPVTPVSDMASHLLMHKTAEITNNLSLIEKTAPILESNSQEAFHMWRPKFKFYKSKNGTKSMQDLCAEDVTLYYSFILNLNVREMSSSDFFDRVDNFHQFVLDDITILENELTMENVKEYDRTKLENYARKFIFLLDRYPNIRLNLSEPVIIKTFFKNMKPTSFGKELLKLDISTIRLAITTFNNKLKSKDIQCSENLKDKITQSSGKDSKKTSEENLGNSKSSKFKNPCPNCEAAGRKSTHRIWFCREIDYCSICKQDHLAMGPLCPKKNKELFDYEQFLSNREKKKSSISTDNNSGKAKSWKQSATNDQPSFAAKSASQLPTSQPDVDGIKSLKVDKKLKRTLLKQRMEQLKQDINALSSDSGEVNYEDCVAPVIAFFDSGCNVTTVNNKSNSDSPMLFNRIPHEDPCIVQDAIGTESKVEAHGYLLNHRINLVSKFVHPLISVSQVNLNNNAFSIFTLDRCYSIRFDNSLTNTLNDMIQYAADRDLIVIQGDQVNGMFEIPINECMNKSDVPDLYVSNWSISDANVSKMLSKQGLLNDMNSLQINLSDVHDSKVKHNDNLTTNLLLMNEPKKTLSKHNLLNDLCSNMIQLNVKLLNDNENNIQMMNENNQSECNQKKLKCSKNNLLKKFNNDLNEYNKLSEINSTDKSKNVICNLSHDDSSSLINLNKLNTNRSSPSMNDSSSNTLNTNNISAVDALPHPSLIDSPMMLNLQLMQTELLHDINSQYELNHTMLIEKFNNMKNILLKQSHVSKFTHVLPDLQFAGSSYFTNVPSVHVSNGRELVRYFHEAWDHCSEEHMCSIVKNNLIDNIPACLTVKLIHKYFPQCDDCPTGNLQKRAFIPDPVDRALEIGDEFELDIHGPITDPKGKSCLSFSGQKYYLTCKDIKSRKRFGFLLRNRGYLLRYIKHLVVLVKQQNRRIKFLRIDNEFLTDDIRHYLARQRITPKPCIPYEHETLGHIERDNRTITEIMMKIMLNKPHITMQYWGMCYYDVLNKLDIMPHPLDPTTTPYEMWHGNKMNMLHNPSIPFGSVVKAHIALNIQTGFSGRSIDTIYVGMAHGRHGGILLFNPLTKHTLVRRSFRVMGPVHQPKSELSFESPNDIDLSILNVDLSNEPSTEIYEHQFGNDHGLDHDPIDFNPVVHIPSIPDVVPDDEFVVEKILNHKGSFARPNSLYLFVRWLGFDDSANSWIKWSENQDLAALDSYLANNPDLKVPVFRTKNSPVRDQIRAKNPRKNANLKSNNKMYNNKTVSRKRLSTKLNKLAQSLANKVNGVNYRGNAKQSMLSQCKHFEYITSYHAPKTNSLRSMCMNAYHNVMSAHMKLTSDVPKTAYDIPKMSDAKHWYDATDVELENMTVNNVWTNEHIDISNIPKHLLLPSQLIYEKQYHPDGTFKKYKCRLVIRGDKWYDIYNMNKYASTVKSESVRIMLSIAAIEDMIMESVDVKSAFLYSPLKSHEYIYMRRPPGLSDTHMPNVVRIRKCIYGMPEASAYFHEHSDAVLKSFGCTPIPEDDCVYVLEHEGEIAYILKHVDDFGLMSKSQRLIDYIKSKLSEHYTITVNPDMSYYLGYHIIRDRHSKSIILSQRAYIDNMETRYDIHVDAVYPSTPMEYVKHDNNVPLVFLDAKGIVDYQSRVGSLLYLAIMTRPDILYAVSSLSRCTKSPTTVDLHAINRVLLYVIGTKHLGLKLYSDEGVKLYATVDASYACHPDSKSHTGCTLHIGRMSGSIITLSKKQTVTADSSTVAEFIATHVVTKEIMWARSFLSSVKYPQSDPTVLFEDNMSTISMIKNKSNGNRTKHIEVRYNLVREQQSIGTLRMVHLSTEKMTSDMLSKPLSPSPFISLRRNILGMLTKLKSKHR